MLTWHPAVLRQFLALGIAHRAFPPKELQVSGDAAILTPTAREGSEADVPPLSPSRHRRSSPRAEPSC